MSFPNLPRRAIFGMTAVAAFSAVSIYEIGKRNLWFEPKVTYYTTVADAEGLRVGGVVTVSGLRMGDIAALTVDQDNRIRVTMNVKREVAGRLRNDAVAIVSRSFIIGEKRIELSPGAEVGTKLKTGATLPVRESADLADFLSGRKLAELMEQVEALISGLNGVVKATDDIFGQYRQGAFNRLIERVEPLSANALKLTDDMLVLTGELRKKSRQLPVFLESGAGLFDNIQQDLFANNLAKTALGNVNRTVEPLAERQELVRRLLANMDDLSKDLERNPRFGKELLDVIKELNITLRALQKTWLLEDKADAVRSGKE